MEAAHAVERAYLCNLLGYAEEILKMGERVVSDLARDALFSFYEHDVTSLEGVAAPGGEDCWLRITRLREIDAPEPDPAYLSWVAKTPSQAPFDKPRLVETNLVSTSLEIASDLLEAGLASDADIMKPFARTPEAAEMVDVLLRLDNLPEFKDAFSEWVAGPWSAWEQAEKPRRRSIAFYNRLFEVQQRMSAMGDDVAVEAVFGVGIARWNHAAGKINAPLIEAVVELEMNAADGAIIVRARQQPPRLALRAFDLLEIDGVGKLYREASEQLDRCYNDPDIGFSPYERASYESVLRMCQARLFSGAVYERDARPNEADRTPPAADDKLRVSDTWVIYVRQRSVNFRCEDIRRLTARVRDTHEFGDLPGPGRQLISRPTSARIDEDVIDLGNTVLHTSPRPIGPTSRLSGGRGQKEEQTFFFPLPYNEDQMEIVRRLEDTDENAVVVQGPPGTGKTHTIANIIAHYMATGRRVLVSAREPEALAAIQQKLPESIRDLAIAVIHSDRQGTRQLEMAVDILASQIKQIDKREYNERRIQLERALAETRASLLEADHRIGQHAVENMTSVTYRGEQLMPMELAARIEAERHAHIWFPDDLGMEGRFEPRFSTENILEAGRIRAELGPDLAYTAEEVPDPAKLPDVPRLLVAHEALVRERKYELRSAAGDLPFVSFGPRAGMEQARTLHAWLKDLATWAEETALSAPWLVELYRLLVGAKATSEAIREGLKQLCREWSELWTESQAFALRDVQLSVEGCDAAFTSAMEALAAGRKPFGLFSFGQSSLKSRIEAVRIDGAPPSTTEGWSCVRDYISWQRRAEAFANRWAAAAKAGDFPKLEGPAGTTGSELWKIGGLVDRLRRFHTEASQKLEHLEILFPYGVDHRRVVFSFEITVVLDALSASLSEDGHSEAIAIRQALDQVGGLGNLPLHSAILAIRDGLGDPDVSPRELGEGWREVLEEARRLYALRGCRFRLNEICDLISASGAPRWAAMLLQKSPEDTDPWVCSTWKDSWDWARADGHMRGLSSRSTLAALSARRATLDEKQRELLAEIVRVRTFIALKQGITERIASALTKFAMKVRQLGAGTGKSAERHRRAIREATLEASDAVPCWILPEWRVAEQLSSELATFDLVIIDEASQSDITALPTVLRGKKLLVVGDDKQVSPSAVGMEEKTVVQLRETFLRGMDIANYLEPTTSLYDLASMTSPGSVIMLREHFRCVEPIIRFSSRFYPKALVPLRVATAEERLDPPLIDIYVPQGRKLREVNDAEATAIVDEISRIVEDPAYSARSLGVISLIGDKQAKYIQDRLTKAIGTEAIARHRIMCGNASSFQGQERDIIFLSMVACPATSRAQTARLMEQRFNVALSRARDRMYLVRSVAAAMLSPTDLKALVIEHFRDPMTGVSIAQSTEVLDACDSDFERDVGRCLLELGYRVRPQVPVGPFRIDFVVEGDHGRRLAIELDGDRYHGPERWAEDQYRQRALERLGWVFWRCWGSHWLSDRQGSLDDLLATLGRLGIEPVGGNFSPQVWTEHRTVGDAPVISADVRIDETEPPQSIPCPADSGGPAGPMAAAGPQSDVIDASDREAIVEPGDTVIVRFADDNRVRRIMLSRDAHEPNVGIVHVGQPIGEALLGNSLEEELDLLVAGVSRRVIIEKITKAA